MNSMIDPQNEVASLATVAPEEFYGAYNGNDDDGPTCDDVAEPVYDGPQDDGHIYPDDADYDPSSDFWEVGTVSARLPTPLPPPGG